MSVSRSINLIRIKIEYENEVLFDQRLDSSSISIGRIPPCDIQLPYSFISGLHCQIYRDEGGWNLKDMDSKHGVIYKGAPITKVRLQNKDSFLITKLKILVFFGDDVTDGPNGDTAITLLTQPRYAEGLKTPQVMVKKASQRSLEVSFVWHGRILETRDFWPGEKVRVGRTVLADIVLPVVEKGWVLARPSQDARSSRLLIPFGLKGHLIKEGRESELEPKTIPQASVSEKGVMYSLGIEEIVYIDVAPNMEIYVRYVPAPPRLTKRKSIEPEVAFKQAMIISLLIHLFFGLGLIKMAPPLPENTPHLKNVPDRFARLLVEETKPIVSSPPPTLPPPPTTQPPVVQPIKTKVEPVIAKRISKELVKKNKFPIEVKDKPIKKHISAGQEKSGKTTIAKDSKIENIEALGALAVLSGSGLSTDTAKAPKTVAINKNAGGKQGPDLSVSDVTSDLKTSGGKLVAGGGGSTKGKGKGFGQGTEFGTQGLSGTAGSRGVGAMVVGKPKLGVPTNKGKPEGLSRAQVMAVVQKHSGEIQSCYERSLLNNAGLQGRVELEWDIEAAGSVSAVRVKKSTLEGGDELLSCLKRVFSDMNFPKATNGQGTTPLIGFPFGRI